MKMLQFKRLQSNSSVDIGNYLVKGTNTIKMKVVTTMINRRKAESELFKGGSSFGSVCPPGVSEEQAGGMLGSIPGGMPPQGGRPSGAGGIPGFGPDRVSTFGASGIAGSRPWSGKEVAYGMTWVEIIPYGSVKLKK